MFKLVLKKIPKITFNHCILDAKGIMQKFHYNNFLNNRGLLKWAWPYHADQTLTVLASATRCLPFCAREACALAYWSFCGLCVKRGGNVYQDRTHADSPYAYKLIAKIINKNIKMFSDGKKCGYHGAGKRFFCITSIRLISVNLDTVRVPSINV